MINIKNLSFTYSNTGIRALKDINLNLKKGEFCLITGASRAGKSTLCLTLNRLIPEHLKGTLEGKIIINGKDISSKTAREMIEKVGIVFQDYESQLFSTRVDLEVAFGLENRGVSSDEIKRKVGEMIELTGLSGLESRNPVTLSGGQKQRLAIASVLAMDLEMIILDEPLTDLDSAGRDEVVKLLEQLERKGKTVLIVEHGIELIEIVKKCYILKDGSIFRSGAPENVFSESAKVVESGIYPHPLIELFEKLGFPEKPLTISSAEKILKSRGLKVRNEVKTERKEGSGDQVISIEDLNFQYPNGVTAIKNINLKINSCDFVALVGKNGSGKTTLAKHLNRLLQPSTGRILLFKRDIMSLKRSEIGRMVGYVFQNPDHQIFSETVYDEVAFAPRNFGFSEREIKERTERAIKTVGLDGCERADPFTLTRGEREKVAVASVLSATPEIIILDEPTTGLDYREVKSTMELLRGLNENGKTIIIITHNMNIVAEYTKRVVAMKEGGVIFDGKTRDFFSEKNILKESGVKAPLITELSRHLGFTALSVSEFLRLIYV